MLPPLASTLDVGLGPDRLAWTRREKRLLRAPSAVTSSQSVTVKPDRPAWEPSLEALAQGLEREALPAGSTLNVVLSNHFVRYTLVPWNDLLHSEPERLAFAARAFHSVHGNTANGWDVRLSHDRFGAPSIASAVDKALLNALAAIASARSLRLGTVQPYFMSAFNRFRHQLGREGAFVLAEPGKLVIGTYGNDCWQWIGAARLAPGEGLAAQVQQMLYQGQQWDIRSVAVHTGAPSSDAWTAGSTLAVSHLLPGNALSTGPESVLALAGGA